MKFGEWIQWYAICWALLMMPALAATVVIA